MTDQMSTDALELYCRNRAKSIGELTEYDRILLMDVSARLCALQSENAEKDKEIAKLKDVNISQRRGLRQLRDELSRVEAERDAAVADLLEAAITPCSYCKSSPINGGNCDMDNDDHEMYACWKWRGAQGEG